FFFQAEVGIRYFHVTGVQTCALPISEVGRTGMIGAGAEVGRTGVIGAGAEARARDVAAVGKDGQVRAAIGLGADARSDTLPEIALGRARGGQPAQGAAQFELAHAGSPCSQPRSSPRARCSCALEVPTAMPSSVAISWCF